MAQGRRRAVTVTEQSPAGSGNFDDLSDDSGAVYNPNDPHLNEPLLQHQNPLALAAKRMEQDRELDQFARTQAVVDAEEDQLERATEEFPESEDGEAHVSIWRHPTGGGKAEWMHDATMSEWRGMGKAWLGRTFGAGRYEVMMYRGGQRGLYKRPKCTISREGADLQKKLWAKEHPEENTPAQAPAASVGGQGTERLAQVMIQGFTQLGELIARQNQGGGKTEFLKELMMYKEIFSPPASVPAAKDAGAGSTLDLAVKIAGLIHPGNAEKSTLETFAEIFKDFAPGIIEAVKSAAPQPQFPQRAIAGPQPGRVDNPANPNGAPPNVNMIQNAVVRAQLKNLIAKAEKDSDPALYAELIFDNLDSIPAEFVQRFLQDPNWMQWLAGFDARVMQHQDWFNELYVELKRVIEEEAAKQEPGQGLTGGENRSTNAGNIILAGDSGVPDDSGSEETD
jgi:hypothetical protein